MKARIDIKYEEQVVQEETKTKGFFGSRTVITPVTYGRHVLYLYLEASEEEKAIIKLNRLDEIVLDGKTFDTSQKDAQGLAEAKNDIERKILQEVYEATSSFVRKITLADYLENPFKWGFDTVVEANEYADKLKTKILPRIKEIMATNSQTGPTSESFEL
jgi:hypothetical protein